MEDVVRSLQSQTMVLLEPVDDLENRSRHSNLKINNIPEQSEKDQDPIYILCPICCWWWQVPVFSTSLRRQSEPIAPSAPDQEMPVWWNQGHLLSYSSFQDRENILRWARQHKLDYHGSKMNVHQDIRAALAKKQAAFNVVENSLLPKRNKIPPAASGRPPG